MSNKTIIPGIGTPNQNANPFANPQTAPTAPTYKGTQFPGQVVENPAAKPVQDSHKPIMGFLYSVSRTNCGEYWPLYLGLNTIGRSDNSSIKLNEATVSENHAEIVIRQMKNPDGVIASIQDSRSTCGTLINGSSLGFDPRECKNGDIITIGEHYELLFILINAKDLHLEPVADFIAADQQPQTPNPVFPPFQSPIGGNNGRTIPMGAPVGGGSPFTGGEQRNTSTIIMPPTTK